MENKNLPKVSIITCTYNGERIIEEYFKNLFLQDYPLDKIEIIIADGGSNDNTLNIIEKYKKKYPKNIKFFENKTKSKVGRGNGEDTASRKANGDFLILIDQDNILIQKDWISKGVNLLLKFPEINAIQSRLHASDESNLFDKYLNAIGIEDPFVVDYSLVSQITFNPKKFTYNPKEKFYTYEVNREKFYYAGDNGFVIRKKDFFENGGYTQDIDNFYRMALSKKKYKIAVPKNLFLHHKSSTSLKNLLSKKVFYVRIYLSKNFQKRDFSWFNLISNSLRQNLKFIYVVLKNLLFFPELFRAIKKVIIEKKSFWLIHPFATFSITLAYIQGFFLNKISEQQKEVKI